MLESPYKTVSQINNFARKHRYPLQCSAFTYIDNYIPSRLDFAKERYGGPFTTEQVENVKMFLRILFGVGPLIVMTATLEFISTQSPQSMKGFLIGLFFAIRGLFQFLNSIIIVPLSLKHPWASGEMLENPPVTNCGFVYLLFTCVVGLIGLIMFSVAATKYKYRARNEGMFRQMDIEEIFEREIERASMDNVSDHNKTL